MSKYLVILIAVASLGLTPAERKIVQQARMELHQAQSDYSQALQDKDLALHQVADAEMQSATTAQELDKLKVEIKVSHDNEVRLNGLVQKYEPFYTQGHKWWGIGAILLGFGILAKHLFILIAALVILSILLGVAYSLFTKTPIGAVFGIVVSSIRRLFKK